jgi:hypothetical protein
MFDRHTWEKASDGRDWRLIILDGHGSHVTMAFFEYYLKHKILVMVYPPHSTHTLQPLAVVMFKPLSDECSNQLINHTQKTQGLLPIRIADLFTLSWAAWVASFTKKGILKSFPLLAYGQRTGSKSSKDTSKRCRKTQKQRNQILATSGFESSEFCVLQLVERLQIKPKS